MSAAWKLDTFPLAVTAAIRGLKGLGKEVPSEIAVHAQNFGLSVNSIDGGPISTDSIYLINRVYFDLFAWGDRQALKAFEFLLDG